MVEIFLVMPNIENESLFCSNFFFIQTIKWKDDYAPFPTRKDFGWKNIPFNFIQLNETCYYDTFCILE